MTLSIGNMNPSPVLTRQSHRMLQFGVALLLFAGLQGFVFPFLPLPRLGLTAHERAAAAGVLFIVFGLLWPRLKVGSTGARIAFWSFVYSTFATVLAYFLAALWGAGSLAIPLAAGSARGTSLQEQIINVLLISTAPTFIIAVIVAIWGLRINAAETHA